MRRKFWDLIFFMTTLGATLIGLAILYAFLKFLFTHGIPAFRHQDQLGMPSIKFQEMGITTLMLTATSLLIALPFAFLAAIYLYEYGKNKKIANITRYCIRSLASLPSIVYGLFGMLLFVRQTGFGLSILSGAITLAIMLLPILITQTELALNQLPPSYKEASLGLGATTYETMMTLLIPQALPGVFVGITLSIGRIISESAALIFTIGTFARMPINSQTGWLSIFESGTTFTIRAMIEFKEYGNLENAAAIGIVAVGFVLCLNVMRHGVLMVLERDE